MTINQSGRPAGIPLVEDIHGARLLTREACEGPELARNLAATLDPFGRGAGTLPLSPTAPAHAG